MVQKSKEGDSSAGLIIDRNRFHQALLNEVEDYANRLKAPANESDFELRNKFLDKMSFIVD